ncbi:hypothetical protein B9Z19DRAFT_1070269 [Tuber borchii]|uniref:C2H2-type domain-containing protein n=1 Tax=Tuber borchii TaxID=42251 RepID=A0A2T7A9P0_TUBBO|nr:hypothetical protein B9Z19DRAFT_1070269 [Tuber borchii]
MAEVVEPLPSPPDTGPTATSASAPAAPSSPNTTQHGRVDIASSPSSRAAPPIPTITSLAQRFQNTSELNSHLLSLSKAELAAIVMSEAGKSSTTTTTTKPPTPESNKYAHCVYCHEIFDKEYNVGCQVKHYGDREEVDYDSDISKLTCCGFSLDHTEYDECHPAPEEAEPYCYEGKHWDRFIDQGDDERGIWWQEWEESGRTCKDMGCRGMVNPKKRRFY